MTTVNAIKCPFCDGHYALIPQSANGMSIAHSKPPCAKFAAGGNAYIDSVKAHAVGKLSSQLMPRLPRPNRHQRRAMQQHKRKSNAT